MLISVQLSVKPGSRAMLNQLQRTSSVQRMCPWLVGILKAIIFLAREVFPAFIKRTWVSRRNVLGLPNRREMYTMIHHLWRQRTVGTTKMSLGVVSVVVCPKTSHPVWASIFNARLFKEAGGHLMTCTNSLGHVRRPIWTLFGRMGLHFKDSAFPASCFEFTSIWAMKHWVFSERAANG